MIINKIEINNFRSIKNVSLNCDNLTVIIGRNGAGKSSILKAIEVFYDVSSLITNEDYFNNDISSPIEIKITFSALKDEEKDEFNTYLKDDKLSVTKRINCEGDKHIQKYYATLPQIPQFAEVRKSAGREKINKFKELVDEKTLASLEAKVKSASDVDAAMAAYEDAHKELLTPVEKEEQFFGVKSVGGGKLDKYTKFVFVPAVREASDEIGGKKSAVYQLLDMIVYRKINARKDIKDFKNEFEQKINLLYSSDNLTELPELGRSISKTLGVYAPGSSLNLTWVNVKPPEVPMPDSKATLVEDDYEGEITRKGHGLQRALILTLLQHLAVAVPEPIEHEQKELGTQQTAGPDMILAIEEPELFLHPARCRYMSNLLNDLANKSGMGLGSKNQVLFASHSPYFIDLKWFYQLRVVKKVKDEETKTVHSKITYLTFENAKNEIVKITGIDPDKVTKESFKARATPVMNAIVNEGFFADVVVIVEGLSEVGILWKIQEMLNKDWNRRGITVIPVDCKNNIDRPVIIFKGLEIPVYVLFDGDSHNKGKGNSERSTIETNHRLLKLLNGQVVDFPEDVVTDKYSIFGDKLEIYLTTTLGEENYREIIEIIKTELGYSEDRECKNSEGMARIVEIAYQKGLKLPMLEAIVEKITSLTE